MALHVGSRFLTDKEAYNAVICYGLENKVQFVVNDSKSVTTANKTLKNKFPEHLKYSYIRYVCKHYGARDSKSLGIRPNQSTHKVGCQAMIYVSADKEKGDYVITKMVSDHNHEISDEYFKSLPESRRLSIEEKQHAESLLSFNLSVKNVKTALKNQTDKSITLKDIHNLKQHLKNRNGKEENQIMTQLELLKEKDPSCKIQLHIEDEQLNMIFIQTTRMKEFSDKFPEMVMIDGTYRVNNAGFCLYTIMVKDGNGRGEAVAQAYLANEKRDSLLKFFEAYSETNDKCKTIVVDKDFNEISVLRELWPTAAVILCRFHVLKTFKRELAQSHLSTTEKETLQKCLQGMVYAKDVNEYEKEKAQLLAKAPETFANYFEQNWDNCRGMWSKYLTRQTTNFGTYTTNNVESRHQKLKECLKPTLSLSESLRLLINFQLDHESETRARNVTSSVKKSYRVGDTVVENAQLRSWLTHLGAELAIKQKELALKNQKKYQTLELENASHCQFLLENDIIAEVKMTENTAKCTCPFFLSHSLACEHIFFVAHKSGIPCGEHWFPDRWKRAFQVDNAGQFPHTASGIRYCSTLSNPPLSKKEKFKELNLLVKSLCDDCSDQGHNVFMARYDLLSQLQKAWREGKAVSLLVLDDTPFEDQMNTLQDQSVPGSPVQFPVPEQRAATNLAPEHRDEASADSSIPAPAPNQEDQDEASIDKIPTLAPDQQVNGEASVHNTQNCNIQSVQFKLPPSNRKRGRPKGSNLNAIGLQRNRLRLSRKPQSGSPRKKAKFDHNTRPQHQIISKEDEVKFRRIPPRTLKDIGEFVKGKNISLPRDMTQHALQIFTSPVVNLVHRLSQNESLDDFYQACMNMYTKCVRDVQLNAAEIAVATGIVTLAVTYDVDVLSMAQTITTWPNFLNRVDLSKPTSTNKVTVVDKVLYKDDLLSVRNEDGCLSDALDGITALVAS